MHRRAPSSEAEGRQGNRGNTAYEVQLVGHRGPPPWLERPPWFSSGSRVARADCPSPSTHATCARHSCRCLIHHPRASPKPFRHGQLAARRCGSTASGCFMAARSSGSAAVGSTRRRTLASRPGGRSISATGGSSSRRAPGTTLRAMLCRARTSRCRLRHRPTKPPPSRRAVASVPRVVVRSQPLEVECAGGSLAGNDSHDA